MKHRILSREQEYDLFEEGTHEAHEEILWANQGLVVDLVQKYISRWGDPLEREDLMQQGNLILWQLIKKFDHTRGNKFSTYWYASANTYMERYVMETLYWFKIPKTDSIYLTRIKAIGNALKEELGRMPTDEEFLNCEEVKKLTTKKPGQKYPQVKPEIALALLWVPTGYTSLDAPLDGDTSDPISLIDIVEDPVDRIGEQAIKNDLDFFCKEYLNDKQSYVLIERIYKERPSQDVAEELGVSYQRVYQIGQEIKAIFKRKLEVEHA